MLETTYKLKLSVHMSKVKLASHKAFSIIILKFNPPILLDLPGNVIPYCPAVGAIWKINSSNDDFTGKSMFDFCIVT